MQQRSCEDLQLLISKYADDAATPDEQEVVDCHIAYCDKCACKLTEYMEIAALFSELPIRPAAPQLRNSVYREIGRMQEEKRKEEEKSQKRGWSPPAWPQLVGSQSAFASFFKTAGPFAFATASVALLFSLILLNANLLPGSREPEQPTDNPNVNVAPGPPVPTYPATLVAVGGNGNIPAPQQTKAGLASPAPESSRNPGWGQTVAATRSRTAILKLLQGTPVIEAGEVSKTSTWHTVRDAAYDYAISYPPNWWTHTQGNTRYFYPWGVGGTRHSPYSVSMEVKDNPKGYDAESAQQLLFGGSCQVVKTGRAGVLCLRRYLSDANEAADELYGFDSKHIYSLRLSVPRQSALGSFDERWHEAQSVFTRMSASFSLASELAAKPTSEDHVLFLNGTDLWTVRSNGKGLKAITRGYTVGEFALAPDLRTVAFTAKNSPADVWSKHIYLARLDSDSLDSVLLWTGGQIHDIAWYSNSELLTIANTPEEGLGIYRLSLPDGRGTSNNAPSVIVQSLVKLGVELARARGLAVSPDRQLITFVAPVGENMGTDIYAVRPDGSDLRTLVSHADPIAPIVDAEPILQAESQAIKSYVWTNGSLERNGYEYRLLFTCGNSISPTWYRGGFLYSAPGNMDRPILDPYQLGVSDPAKLQIIQIAYSHHGKVAMAGYYNDREDRVDQLVGLWTADLVGETLSNVKAQPLPESPHGITDLRWSADGASLIYRETIPTDPSTFSSRYDGRSGFMMVRLDVATGERTVLYDTNR